MINNIDNNLELDITIDFFISKFYENLSSLKIKSEKVNKILKIIETHFPELKNQQDIQNFQIDEILKDLIAFDSAISKCTNNTSPEKCDKSPEKCDKLNDLVNQMNLDNIQKKNNGIEPRFLNKNSLNYDKEAKKNTNNNDEILNLLNLIFDINDLDLLKGIIKSNNISNKKFDTNNSSLNKDNALNSIVNDFIALSKELGLNR
ncbi:hypothetical protein [Lyticum sinuosum]|uniref:Uncharacterized protein n=1 Tax=Lyticum sinuosum TaxID=1332059 RepID=A0AAE4VK09_9RICK|nr:hypothetical protein [Lyticum sinuosum]MDZ5761361.1 hypothetical protein [Lyticum sinuosum]